MVNIDFDKSDKCSTEYSMYISFNYNQKIVDLIRELPTRYWNKDSKEWEVPSNKFKIVTEMLQDYELNVTGCIEQALSENKLEYKNIDGFEFKTKPFSHQIDGFKYGMTHNRWLLADEQGLGKTKQVIDIAVAKKLQFGYKHCLIICGVNGLKWNWQNEIKIHSNESGYIIGQRTRRNKTVIGSTNDKIFDLENLSKIDSYFIITNIESLRSDDIVKLLKQHCDKGNINMIAMDECHKCKTPSAQQTKGLLKLKPECRIAMTGTPIMNTPLDLFVVLKWLGYESHSFYQFKSHYCVLGGFGGHDVVGYKNMNELQESVNELMLRRLKDEVLDLPEKTYVDEYIEMTPKQEQIYREVTSIIKSNIDQIKMANNPLAELIRMRQATGYTGILSSTIQESAKIDRLEELVDEAISNNKKVVIFSNWTQMTQPIYNRLNLSYSGVVITGETNDEVRQLNVDTFQNSDVCQFIVGTIGAMGTGLTLTAGTVVIFADHPWTRAAYDQAVDRCHRIGQKNNITVYNLLCKNTIDERIWEIVNKKGVISDALIDGKLTGNKLEMLNFLLS